MKKLFVLTIGSILLAGLLLGCDKNIPVPTPSPDAAAMQTAIPATLNPAATISPTPTAVPPHKSIDSSTFIGENRAKTIALEKAGLTANAVRFDRVELDEDNGIWHYEVEFTKDNLEYDADIKADDGTVLSWEVDTD